MSGKAKPIGINHVALEVGDLDQALEFYGQIFELKLRGRVPGGAFVDLGDQFLALMESSGENTGEKRHFGLVVANKSEVRNLAREAGANLVDESSPDFRDPWGNWIQVVDYAEVQFTKPAAVLRAMGLNLEKNQKARAELAEKGMD